MKAVALLAFFLILFGCRENGSKIQATVRDISESVYASGSIKSKNQYEVFSPVNGIITEVMVEEGDSVRIGTPLLKIFDKPSALNARNAQLAAESARLSANKDKLSELLISIEFAKTKMESDSLVWQRQKNLWSQNIGTKIEFEQKELNYKNSKNNYQTATFRFRETLRQLELNASQAKNIYEINSSLADEYTIKSKIKGKVYSIEKTKGEMVNTLNPIALIGDQDSFILEVQVDERDISRIQPRQTAYISMDSYKGQTFEAIVTAIYPVMNGRTKSFTVEAEFVRPPKLLYPFLTVEANILILKKSDAVIIPRSYLLNDSSVITEDKTTRTIVTGLMDYQNVEVLEGLKAGEYILKPNM